MGRLFLLYVVALVLVSSPELPERRLCPSSAKDHLVDVLKHTIVTFRISLAAMRFSPACLVFFAAFRMSLEVVRSLRRTQGGMPVLLDEENVVEVHLPSGQYLRVRLRSSNEDCLPVGRRLDSMTCLHDLSRPSSRSPAGRFWRSVPFLCLQFQQFDSRAARYSNCLVG